MMTVQGPRVVVSDSVVYAELDEEAVLLNVETGVYFGLDPVGTEIWNMLSAGAAEDEIVAHLVREYDVEAAQATADVHDFLGTLQSKGLVRPATLEVPQ